jgi:hypothetical protein
MTVRSLERLTLELSPGNDLVHQLDVRPSRSPDKPVFSIRKVTDSPVVFATGMPERNGEDTPDQSRGTWVYRASNSPLS